jgi:alginate O-acetyltransferase complex protein AlgI
MAFSSSEFIFLFLPVVVLGFWPLLRFHGRPAAMGWLLIASIVFYVIASLKSLMIVVPSILLDYIIARALLRSEPSSQRRRALFVLGIIANLFFLGYFKYTNFVLDSANVVFGTHFELTRMILPLGISFLVFQKIAFLADVHSGTIRAFNLPDFLLFTLFFPRTIAGPIIHYEEVIGQFAAIAPNRFGNELAVGVCLFTVGLFKKTVIADPIGQYVSLTFDLSESPASADLPHTLILSWLSLIAYTFQLYFDFSGYSDMALGTARMFGVRLPMNFDSPFKSSSIVEFWSRWHITLTRFLTAYIYTPLVLHLTRSRLAKRKSVLRGTRSSASALGALIAFPTLVTMTVSGLWHGAGWQFVCWGLLHGVYLTVNQSWRLVRYRLWSNRDRYERLMRPIGQTVTLLAVVFALVFFRADSMSSALSIFGGLLGLNGVLSRDFQVMLQVSGGVPWSFLELLLPIGAFWRFALLALMVLVLPNSMELLRRFQPACDFPANGGTSGGAEERTATIEEPPLNGRLAPVPGSIRYRIVQLRKVHLIGVDLSPFSALAFALTCVLGLMGISHESAFIYGQF